MKLIFILMVMLTVSNHPSISVLYILFLSLWMMFILKSTSLSLMLIMILIVFLTGILLLLFYITMINDKHTFYLSYLLLIFFIFIFFKNFSFQSLLNFLNSSLSVSLELSNFKLNSMITLGMLMILCSLLMMSWMLSQMKFTRQII